MPRKIEKIEWKEDYFIGDALIDKQHQELFNLINQLIEKFNEKNIDYNWFINILTEFTKYAFKHFAAEEELMLKLNCPDYLSHKKEHKLYRITIGIYNSKLSETRKADYEELLTFLIDWWTEHFTESDLKIKEKISYKIVY